MFLTLASTGREFANIWLIMHHLLALRDALKIRKMLGKKTSNRGRNPLVWLAPKTAEAPLKALGVWEENSHE